jgi:hypothetical protein
MDEDEREKKVRSLFLKHVVLPTALLVGGALFLVNGIGRYASKKPERVRVYENSTKALQTLEGISEKARTPAVQRAVDDLRNFVENPSVEVRNYREMMKTYDEFENENMKSILALGAMYVGWVSGIGLRRILKAAYN